VHTALSYNRNLLVEHSQRVLTRLNIFLCICHVALLYCVDVFMGTYKMLITLFLCLDRWVVGWVVFQHFQVLFLLIFFCINVRVLTMLTASIDGFLLFWQPATS